MQMQDLSYKLNNEILTLKDNKNNLSFKASIEVFSLENVYTVKENTYKHLSNTYYSNQILWGDSELVDGEVKLTLNETKNGLSFQINTSLDKKIRGVKLKLENLPLGELISLTSEDKKITEYGSLYKYPEGWRFLANPLLIFRLENNKYLYIRCFDNIIREKRFFIKKENNSMRVDICLDQDGTLISNKFSAPSIDCGITSSLDEIYTEQSNYMKNTFKLENFENSKIVPSWLKKISLVVIMHMEAFTGHIFHTYEQAFEDIKKITQYIKGEQILVYLAGWEGRYYYKYGNYTPDERLGGEEKLKQLVSSLHQLGCKVMAMYGMNIANKTIPEINKIYQESEFETISGGKYNCGSVDWEGAHHYDFNDLTQLNVGHKKWQDYLFNQIKDATLKYNFDGAFLDIAACYTYDKNAYLYDGVVSLCDRLRTIKNDFLVSGEAFYDGLAKAMPLFQSGHTDGKMHYHDRLSEKIFTQFAREFAHLSLGDPGRGSTGVHEQGTNIETSTPLRKGIIPTLALVEDTINNHFDKVKPILEQANEYYKRYLL